MTDKIYDQIVTVRASGKCNMLDTTAVQHHAYEHEYFELTLFIEEYKKDYVDFIFYGKRD